MAARVVGLVTFVGVTTTTFAQPVTGLPVNLAGQEGIEISQTLDLTNSSDVTSDFFLSQNVNATNGKPVYNVYQNPGINLSGHNLLAVLVQT